MKSIKITFTNLPTNLPVTVEIEIMSKPYSEVRLQRTFDEKGNPAILPRKYWYVYFYYRNAQGVMQKFMYHHNINTYKVLKEREKVGIGWVKAYELLLHQGFNPTTKDGVELSAQKRKVVFTVLEALDYALENKKGELKENTYDDYDVRVGVFKKWLKDERLDHKLITEIIDENIIDFLNWLIHPKGRKLGKTSQHNYKRCLSAIFGKLKKDRIIKVNIVDFQTSKDKPIKNTPFTPGQLIALKNYLLANNLEKLYHYMQHLAYPFLRSSEIVRLTVNDIKLHNKTLSIGTKTDRRKTKIIIAPLLEFYKSLELETKNKEDYIFTLTGYCGKWLANEKTRTRHFSDEFNEVKTALGMGAEYSIYSMRHTAALDLYYGYEKTGLTEREIILKMMPITGHKSEDALRNYLREVNAFLPKDYSGDYTMNF